MRSSTTVSALLLLAVPLLVAAKTDLSGCTSSNTVAFGGASVIWYLPDTGEICSFLDCGGGAGAPVYQPGCNGYTGTATITPSFLPGFNAAAATTTTAAAAGSTGEILSSTSDNELPSTTTTVVVGTTSGDAATTSNLMFTGGVAGGSDSSSPASTTITAGVSTTSSDAFGVSVETTMPTTTSPGTAIVPISTMTNSANQSETTATNQSGITTATGSASTSAPSGSGVASQSTSVSPAKTSAPANSGAVVFMPVVKVAHMICFVVVVGFGLLL